MKTSPLIPALLSLGLLLAACSRGDSSLSLAENINKQNQTIIDQQQTLLDQQQKLADQEIRITILSEQVAMDEQILKQLQDGKPVAPAVPASEADAHKVQVVHYLTGFNARLSANIGYGAYADGLSDLNSNLAQNLLDIKDPIFIDDVNRILCLYNYAGELWSRIDSDNDQIVLSPSDRYKYAAVGVNFVDSYNPRPSDVKKFWVIAVDDLSKLVDNNKDLGLSSVLTRN